MRIQRYIDIDRELDTPKKHNKSSERAGPRPSRVLTLHYTLTLSTLWLKPAGLRLSFLVWEPLRTVVGSSRAEQTLPQHEKQGKCVQGAFWLRQLAPITPHASDKGALAFCPELLLTIEKS